MSKKLQSFTDGTHVFQETEDEGKFLFYRNDEKELGDVEDDAMHMYQNYICVKMMQGEISGAIGGGIETKMSEDGKVMLVSTTIAKLDLPTIVIPDPNVIQEKKNNPVKRMIKSVFGLKNK